MPTFKYRNLQKANALLLSKGNKYQVYSLFSCVWLLHQFHLAPFLSVFTFPVVWQSHFLFPITISCVIFHFSCTSISLFLHTCLQLFLAFQKSTSDFPDFLKFFCCSLCMVNSLTLDNTWCQKTCLSYMTRFKTSIYSQENFECEFSSSTLGMLELNPHQRCLPLRAAVEINRLWSRNGRLTSHIL